MNQDELLEAWCAELLARFEIIGTPIEVNAILSLAGKAAHTVVRPAAPLTTFIAGYAAGLAAGSGQASDAVAIRSAILAAQASIAERAEKQEQHSELDA